MAENGVVGDFVDETPSTMPIDIRPATPQNDAQDPPISKESNATPLSTEPRADKDPDQVERHSTPEPSAIVSPINPTHSPSPSLAECDTPGRSNKRPKHRQSSTKATEITPEDDAQEITRKEALKALTEIECNFAMFREKMYHEKMAQVEAEEAAIRNGTHPILVSSLKEIEERKDSRLAAASARLRQEELSFQRKYEAAVDQAETDFICKRGELRRQMLDDIESKRWRMYDEKRKLDAADSGHAPTGILDRTACTKRRKAIKAEVGEWKAIIASGGFPAATISGLTKNEINEDLESIGIQVSRHHGAGGRNKKPVHGNKPSIDMMVVDGTPFSPNVPLETNIPASDVPSYSDIRVEGEQLRYRESVYQRNDKVFLYDNGSKYSVKIIGITHSELIAQRTDGSKTRIPLEHLEDGRMQLDQR